MRLFHWSCISASLQTLVIQFAVRRCLDRIRTHNVEDDEVEREVDDARQREVKENVERGEREYKEITVMVIV